MNRIAMGLTLAAAALAAGGCGENTNHPFKKAEPDNVQRQLAARGYQEIQRGDTLYVVASSTAARRVNEGKEPAMRINALGLGDKGGRVVVEDNAQGLGQHLIAEYKRRHGMAGTGS